MAGACVGRVRLVVPPRSRDAVVWTLFQTVKSHWGILSRRRTFPNLYFRGVTQWLSGHVMASETEVLSKCLECTYQCGSHQPHVGTQSYSLKLNKI